ncbi:hypothetical protein Xen7305DRAFT_00047460 [Xenococcus sp. PCC 7305]|nr:hypothetical protein Xen7305DRAFT_00047460 [Xenococcus sp. PCC 7305]
MFGFRRRTREKIIYCNLVKLLLDENLSDKIIPKIIDLFPNSVHVKTLGLTNTDDLIIWDYAKENDYVIISKDSDFHQRSILFGHPPKFIYLRIGNSPTSKIVNILRDNFDIVTQFNNSQSESILVLG